MPRRLGLAVLLLLACACGSKDVSPLRLPAELPAVGDGFENAFFQTLGTRMVSGSSGRWLLNGTVFDALVEDIGRARTSVNVVLYIWHPGEPSNRIVQALTKRARAGVACRVIVDPVGSTPAFEKEVRPSLVAAGCDVRAFRPLGSHSVGVSAARNHRKIVVIDGRIAYTGGFGFDPEWLGDGLSRESWRDTAIRVEGPVAVQLQVPVAQNWQEAGGQLLPSSDFPELPPHGEMRAAFISSTGQVGPSQADRMTQLLIGTARTRLWIATAYFVPNDVILGQLAAKARSGTDVRVLVPGPIDDVPEIRAAQRSLYAHLLEAGVRIFEYQPSMMHAKTLIVDGLVSAVGSTNLDPFSLNRLEEGSLVLEDARLTGELAAAYERDLQHSKEMHPDSAEIPGFWGRIERMLFRFLGDASGR